jgi:NAD(P)-dependent dehydrogenase (short-subunit alcohol dehydrogenase family)
VPIEVDKQRSSGLRTALVVGANGGIGSAVVRALDTPGGAATIVAASRRPLNFVSSRIRCTQLDLTDESSIAELAAQFDAIDDLDLVLVATGMLHDFDGVAPEKRLSDIAPENLARSFAVNTVGPALMAKHFLPRLARDRTSVFAALSARVGSIGDNRKGGWYAYRASKAALNMIIKTAAIELARMNPGAVCIGLHPGTVDTGLSRPFQRHVPPEQLFTPEEAAAKLLVVIANAGPEDSGCCLAWDGSRIPP